MVDSYEQLANAFVGLAERLVADYDVIELAQELVDNSMSLLPIAAAGIVIGGPQGDLTVIASSSEQTRLLEILQVEVGIGPCLLAYRTAKQVLVDDFSVDRERWPDFAERAAEYHYRSVSALPLRLRDERVGALNLFGTEVGALSPTHLAIGQALADVATIGILNHRTLTHSDLINQQLQSALNTRVIIEQAKGCSPSGETSIWTGPSCCCGPTPGRPASASPTSPGQSWRTPTHQRFSMRIGCETGATGL